MTILANSCYICIILVPKDVYTRNKSYYAKLLCVKYDIHAYYMMYSSTYFVMHVYMIHGDTVKFWVWLF